MNIWTTIDSKTMDVLLPAMLDCPAYFKTVTVTFVFLTLSVDLGLAPGSQFSLEQLSRTLIGHEISIYN